MTTYTWCKKEWNITIIAKCQQYIWYSICFTDITWWSYEYKFIVFIFVRYSLLTFLDRNRWFLLPQTKKDEEEDQWDEDLKSQHPLKRKKKKRTSINTCYDSNKTFPRQSPVPLKWSFTGIRVFTLRLSLTVSNFRLWSSSPHLQNIPNPISFLQPSA